MSYTDYKNALELINKNKKLVCKSNGCSNKTIEKAERKLKLKFSSMYKEFLQEFGALSFGSEEIYGIVSDDIDLNGVPNGIWYTLTERKEVNMPEWLLVIYDTGSEELFCLDFNSGKNEPKVVVYVPGIDNEYQTYEEIANDFGEFLLERITFELEEEN